MRGVRGSGKLCAVSECGKPSKAYGYCTAHGHRFKRHGDPLGGGASHAPPGALLKWILDHVQHQSDECIKWPFHSERTGYGRVQHEGERWMASRLMCFLRHGEPPTPEHECAHSCGKGHEGCLNPEHLRWATPAENQADRIAHGTDCRGEKSPCAKLTVGDVLAIRALEGAATRQEVANRYGVTRQNILLIQKRKSWAWLLDEEQVAA